MIVSKLKTKIKQIGAKNFVRDTFNTMTINKVDFNWRCRVLKKDIADYEMLKKKYGYLVNQTDWTAKSTSSIPKKIWICWFQGEENAPDIVKMCIASVRKIFLEYEINVITDDNINSFIEFPEYVSKKYKDGYITRTHYSDLIRLELLKQYGGIWIDATVLCESRTLIDNLFEGNTEFFVFKDPLALDEYVAVSSWLMYAKAQNPYLKTVENMLLEYWKAENYLCNYFLLHIFICIVAELKPDEWKKIPAYSCQPPHILQNELFDVYDKRRFNQLMEMSSIHKLSYKFAEEQFERNDTVYQHLKQLYLDEKV